jgi:hypothetical protein
MQPNDFGATAERPTRFIFPEGWRRDGFSDEVREELRKRLNVPLLINTLYDIAVQAPVTAANKEVNDAA